MRSCRIISSDEKVRRKKRRKLLLCVFLCRRLVQKGADKCCLVFVLTVTTNLLKPDRTSSEHNLSMSHNLSDFQALKWEVLGANPVKILKRAWVSYHGAFWVLQWNAGLLLGVQGLPNIIEAFSVGQGESQAFQDGWQSRQAASLAHLAKPA